MPVIPAHTTMKEMFRIRKENKRKEMLDADVLIPSSCELGWTVKNQLILNFFLCETWQNVCLLAKFYHHMTFEEIVTKNTKSMFQNVIFKRILDHLFCHIFHECHFMAKFCKLWKHLSMFHTKNRFSYFFFIFLKFYCSAELTWAQS